MSKKFFLGDYLSLRVTIIVTNATRGKIWHEVQEQRNTSPRLCGRHQHYEVRKTGRTPFTTVKYSKHQLVKYEEKAQEKTQVFPARDSGFIDAGISKEPSKIDPLEYA